MAKSSWKTLESNIVYENKWIRLIEDKVIRPDGSEGIYAYMDAIPGIVVIAEDNGEIFFINEYKYPIKKYIWNLVTGGLGREEDPLIRAKSELYEEMGIKAENWTDLGNFYTAPEIESTYNHVFLARDLVVNEEHALGEGDEIIAEIKKISIQGIHEMIENGEIDNGLVLGVLMQYFVYTKQSPV